MLMSQKYEEEYQHIIYDILGIYFFFFFNIQRDI